MKDSQQKTIDTIRMLSIDMVEKANSGHPGMPMGAAPMAYTLFSEFLNVNPKHPTWVNRDRFVLSAGHGSALLYSLLHLFGFDLSLDDLKQFRQWGSKTPGHPEYGHTVGVDATTGPLGQGIGMAVGMALAEHHLAATYNRDLFPIVDHYTYAICGDGDMMEGVSSEASSLAGHLGLGKLIVLYDANKVSLDGRLDMSFSEDVAKRYEAYGWQVLQVEDGNDVGDIRHAITQAKQDLRPTLIKVNTTIGYGSPNKGGTSASHGAPLGSAEVERVKAAYGWDFPPFTVPDMVRQRVKGYSKQGQQKEQAWQVLYEDYAKTYPMLAKQFQRVMKGELPSAYDAQFPQYQASEKPMATRVASSDVINALASQMPELFGGSADLGSSNNTFIKSEGAHEANTPTNRNIWFGVREFALGTILNGLALHKGAKVYGATFFVFSDYMRPAIRLAALMKLPITYVFTHDSIAVGEDGPTHEPIEQLMSFRAMPNVHVIRPADAKETVAAWKQAMQAKDHPTMLVLSRQVLPILDCEQATVEAGMEQGAYVVVPAKKQAQAILIATGSEVALATEVQKQLWKQGFDVCVVSMPSWRNFKRLTKVEQQSILPKDVVKISIEAGVTLGWSDMVGETGLCIGIDDFGASAPAKTVLSEYGFQPEIICGKVIQYIKHRAQNV